MAWRSLAELLDRYEDSAADAFAALVEAVVPQGPTARWMDHAACADAARVLDPEGRPVYREIVWTDVLGRERRTWVEARNYEYVDRLWHPTDGSHAASEASAREAKAICFRCPVLPECRRWIFREEAAGRVNLGIVAGMTAEERQAARRRTTAWRR